MRASFAPRWALLGACALLACARLSGDPGPRIVSVSPSGGYQGTPTTVTVLGKGFTLRGVQRLSGGGPSIASDFTVVLGGRSLPATLTAGAGGLEGLQAAVPADLAAGVYDVSVLDPFGAQDTLPRAFSEWAGPAAALSATLTAPASASVGDSVTVSFAVVNGGATAANLVAPGPLTLGGTAAASVSSGPSPSSATVPAGGTALFTWTAALTAPGTLQLGATATGVDGLSGAPLAASASTALTVNPEAFLLTPSDPFGGDGTNFASIFSYQGMVYLGPDYKSQSTSTSAAPANTQSGAVALLPDGTSPRQVPWQLEVQSGVARNSAYSGGALCHTIGFAGCNQGSAQCGPDNEAGRALFASGTIGGTEWYLISGYTPQIGQARYLYMTNPGFPRAAGGTDDLAYVNIAATQPGNTQQITAAHVFQDAVFLGFSANAPVLNVLKKMPPSLPGYTASAGTDIIDLNGAALPAVGPQGTPANPGAPPSSPLQIDTMADFDGALYVANNGGLARSVGTISPCSASGCSNWANATPSAPQWGAATSVVTSSSDLGAMQLAARAVPWVVPFGGRLFAARNTTNGPQLWSCQPTLQPSDPQPQCHPADWSLVAPGTGAASALTQLDDPNNRAITLLAATSAHLFVGFDNPNGVQIYRTANAGASQVSDFAGSLGCMAGAAGCQGLGGNGLTAPAMTRFYDVHAFTYSGNEWLYVSAGASSGGPRIFRLAP